MSACGVNEADGQTEIKSSNKIGLQEKKNSAIHNESKKAKVVSVDNQEQTFGQKLAAAGESIEDWSIVYDPSYVSLDYPGGDVDPKTGVCTDVIIRAYRV